MNMAKIISVVNQKGGTGKSACAANLGVGLALMNKKVLVVDADPQSDVSAGFGFRDCDNSNETLTTLMEMVLNDEDIPEDCFIQHTEEGIDIIYHELIVALGLFPNDFFAAFDCFDHGVHRPDVGGIVVIVGGGQAGHDAGDPGRNHPKAYKKAEDGVFIDLFSRRFFIHDAHTPSKWLEHPVPFLL